MNTSLGLPQVIRIEPSSLCNLSCKHCPTGTVEFDRSIMSEETFDLVIENIKEYINDVKVVVLYHGGEPLVNKNFENMVIRLKKLGIPKIKTVSNGMLLNEARIDALIMSGIDEIEFSLDGKTLEENNCVRVGCDYAKVTMNIKRLIERKLELQVELPHIFISTTQFLKESALSEVDLSRCDVPEYLLREFASYRNFIQGFKGAYAMRWPDMKVDEAFFNIIELKDDKPKALFCNHIVETMTVRVNGDVIPCCYDLTSQIKLGNIYDAQLIDIWNGEKYTELRNDISKGKYSRLCSKCNTINQDSCLYLEVKE